MTQARELERPHGPFVLINERNIYKADAIVEVWQVVAPCLAYASWDNLFTLEVAQEGIPLCILPKEQFLVYEDPAYVPQNLQTAQMLEYLRTRVGGPAASLLLLEETVLQVRNDARADICLHELQRMGAVFGILEQRREFVRLYQNLCQVIRRPSLRGHTLQEIAGLPEVAAEERLVYAWFCPPADASRPISSETLMRPIMRSGCSWRRLLWHRAQLCSHLPPALYDPCFCGSGLRNVDCCAKR